jgi:predicted MFS family arabinose efflux permease
VILTGLALVCLLAVLYSRTQGLTTLLLVRLLHGLSSAMVIPIAVARVAEMAPHAREGEMMGTFSISLTLGMAFGPALGGLLYEHGGFETAFLSLAALGGVGLLVVAVSVPGAAPQRARRPSSMTRMARDPEIIALAWCRLLTAGCTSTLLAYLPIQAAETPIGVGFAGVVITTSLLVSAALQRLAGRLADRSSPIGMLIGGICLLGLLLSLIPSCSARWMLAALAVLIGTARATTISANGALIATLGRVHGTGSLMGMVNTAMAVGLGGGPLVAGICMQRLGLAFAFRAIGLGATLGAVVAGTVLVRRARRAHLDGA